MKWINIQHRITATILFVFAKFIDRVLRGTELLCGAQFGTTHVEVEEAKVQDANVYKFRRRSCQRAKFQSDASCKNKIVFLNYF